MKRWRRALATELGYDPGAALDEPRRVLALLRVFGATRRLADLCMKHPRATAIAVMEGPGPVLVEAARDITDLEGGIGGGETLHGALAPIKARADIAIGIAEIQGGWSAAEASAARTDLAERLIECALSWLLRGAINRGELACEMNDGIAKGVFVLAGGDAAHEDLTPNGPLETVIVYDPDSMEISDDSAIKRMTERAFVRVGAEFRDALEGKSGDYSIFGLRTPLGDGVNGQGLVESRARIMTLADNQEGADLANWLATARIIAGDRTSGGHFLEEIEAIVWPEKATGEVSTSIPKLKGKAASMAVSNVSDHSNDPRIPFRKAAIALRLSLGAQRPIFRTASTREAFTMAGQSGVISAPLAARLCDGLDLASGIVARTQMISGGQTMMTEEASEKEALATLLGYTNFSTLDTVLKGAIADATNAAKRLSEGPHSDFQPFRNPEASSAADEDVTETGDDGEKLLDLGFLGGETLSDSVDNWANLCGLDNKARFSTIAPGLLTALGETQHPDEAARLFDTFIRTVSDRETRLAEINENTTLRDSMIDAFGMFGAVVAPLTETAEGCEQIIEERGIETPASGSEFIARFPAPKDANLEQTRQWRRENIARIGLFAASGDMTFDTAADALRIIDETTLADIFNRIAKEKKAEGLTLFTFDGAARGVPGYAIPIGFVNEQDNPFAEECARSIIDALSNLGDGLFAINPDVSHRPGGSGGPLAPGIEQFKTYIQSEAVANDTMLLARGRVIAGPDERTTKAIRTAVANPRRADILFRDLDRARMQRIRRDRSESLWDFDSIEGGLQDTNLIISTLIYRHAAAQPGIQTANAVDALELLTRAGLVSADVTSSLNAALGFWTRLAILKAFSDWSGPQRDPARKRFGRLIAQAAEVERLAAVQPLMRGYADEVTRLYAQLVLGRPSLGLVASSAR